MKEIASPPRDLRPFLIHKRFGVKGMAFSGPGRRGSSQGNPVREIPVLPARLAPVLEHRPRAAVGRVAKDVHGLLPESQRETVHPRSAVLGMEIELVTAWPERRPAHRFSSGRSPRSV